MINSQILFTVKIYIQKIFCYSILYTLFKCVLIGSE